MARTPVTGSNGTFGLGGSKHTDVIVPAGRTGWTVSIDTDKLSQAQAAATSANLNITWFAWFVVEAGNNPVKQQYTVRFDAPASGHDVYVYDSSGLRKLDPGQANTAVPGRWEVTLTDGDPGVGMT